MGWHLAIQEGVAVNMHKLVERHARHHGAVSSSPTTVIWYRKSLGFFTALTAR